MLGKHGVNISNYSLGRTAEGAVGVVSVEGEVTEAVLKELRGIPAVNSAEIVKL